MVGIPISKDFLCYAKIGLAMFYLLIFVTSATLNTTTERWLQLIILIISSFMIFYFLISSMEMEGDKCSKRKKMTT